MYNYNLACWLATECSIKVQGRSYSKSSPDPRLVFKWAVVMLPLTGFLHLHLIFFFTFVFLEIKQARNYFCVSMAGSARYALITISFHFLYFTCKMVITLCWKMQSTFFLQSIIYFLMMTWYFYMHKCVVI